MYFVPVRKLLRIFGRGVFTKRERMHLSLHESLDTVPDSDRKCSRKWLLLVIMILVCLYIVLYHRSTHNVFIISANMTNQNEDLTKDSLKLNTENLQAADFPENNVKAKESNVNITATSKNTIIVYETTDKNSNNSDVILVSTEENEKYEPMLLSETNDELPVCGTALQQNDEEKTCNKRKLDENLFPQVKMGGYYHPSKCRSRHKVAILVPYRNRERNLAVFIYHMHTFLMKQQLEYRIFIIEQAGSEVFNRGKLFNIGFMEMMKYNEWHCVVLHDVDLLPQNDKILYTCPTFPRHMCGTVVEKAKLTYNQYHTLFGGVSALSVKHYKQINGFSNLYWGWGGEDNDMYWRILSSRIPMVRYNKTIAQYKSLPHAQQPKNNKRYQLLKFTLARCKTDGLSSLVYKVIWTKCRHLYTHILADVNPLKENITDVLSNLLH